MAEPRTRFEKALVAQGMCRVLRDELITLREQCADLHGAQSSSGARDEKLMVDGLAEAGQGLYRVLLALRRMS